MPLPQARLFNTETVLIQASLTAIILLISQTSRGLSTFDHLWNKAQLRPAHAQVCTEEGNRQLRSRAYEAPGWVKSR